MEQYIKKQPAEAGCFFAHKGEKEPYKRLFSTFKGFEERTSLLKRKYTKSGAAPFSVQAYNKLKFFHFCELFLNF